MARDKRANGTGTVYVKHGSYYGRWLTPTGRANRRLGPVRRHGSSEGLTRSQAERRMRELIAATATELPSDPELTIELAGRAFLEQLQARGRSKSHVEGVESHLRVHLRPFFGDKPLDRIADADVTRLLAHLRRTGRKPKTARNVLSTLHSIFDLAVRRGWTTANPCKLVDAPEVQASADIRFLTQRELSAVLEDGIPTDDLGVLEQPLYLMAAMAGLRQGELLGLRWGDLDPSARKVRVRQAWVRGEFKTPKSRRGSRGVPMAEELAAALNALAHRSAFAADEDLVFAHPQTGRPLDRSIVRKRFQRACRRAGVRVVRFHDLRHTFGTRLAASGEISLRTLQEWMGHRDAKTTLIYADYQPGEREAELVSRAFESPDAGHTSQADRLAVSPSSRRHPNA
jgi:integrase